MQGMRQPSPLYNPTNTQDAASVEARTIAAAACVCHTHPLPHLPWNIKTSHSQPPPSFRAATPALHQPDWLARRQDSYLITSNDVIQRRV